MHIVGLGWGFAWVVVRERAVGGWFVVLSDGHRYTNGWWTKMS